MHGSGRGTNKNSIFLFHFHWKVPNYIGLKKILRFVVQLQNKSCVEGLLPTFIFLFHFQIFL